MSDGLPARGGGDYNLPYGTWSGDPRAPWNAPEVDCDCDEELDGELVHDENCHHHEDFDPVQAEMDAKYDRDPRY